MFRSRNSLNRVAWHMDLGRAIQHLLVAKGSSKCFSANSISRKYRVTARKSGLRRAVTLKKPSYRCQGIAECPSAISIRRKYCVTARICNKLPQYRPQAASAPSHIRPRRWCNNAAAHWNANSFIICNKSCLRTWQPAILSVVHIRYNVFAPNMRSCLRPKAEQLEEAAQAPAQ